MRNTVHARRRRRAERNVDSYEIPTEQLTAAEARFRVLYAWLQGYDACMRDMRKRKK